MATSPPRIYLDSCVLISYIEDDPSRLRVITEVLRRAENKEIELITSVLSQAEVAFTNEERDSKALSQEIEDAINGLWEPGSPIQLVEYYPAIGNEAREILRESISKGWSGKGALDAIHLATARRLECAEFFTYDTGLSKYADMMGFSIGPPHNPQGTIPVD